MKDPQIVAKKERPVAYKEIQVTLKEWGKANALFPEIFDWLKLQETPPAGPPFYQYMIIGDEENKFHLRAGVITSKLLVEDAEVKTMMIPSGKYVSYIHKGHPDKLSKSHQLILNWAEENGIELANSVNQLGTNWDGVYEFYLTDPAEEPDLNNWQIEINYLAK